MYISNKLTCFFLFNGFSITKIIIYKLLNDFYDYFSKKLCTNYKLPMLLNRFNFSGNTSLKSTGSARNSIDSNGIVP